MERPDKLFQPGLLRICLRQIQTEKHNLRALLELQYVGAKPAPRALKDARRSDGLLYPAANLDGRSDGRDAVEDVVDNLTDWGTNYGNAATAPVVDKITIDGTVYNCDYDVNVSTLKVTNDSLTGETAWVVGVVMTQNVTKAANVEA